MYKFSHLEGILKQTKNNSVVFFTTYLWHPLNEMLVLSNMATPPPPTKPPRGVKYGKDEVNINKKNFKMHENIAKSGLHNKQIKFCKNQNN